MYNFKRLVKNLYCRFIRWARNFDYRRPSRIILFIAFVVSLILMILDLTMDSSVATYLFILTNGIIVFRLLGAHWIVTIIHIAMFTWLLVKLAFAFKKLPFVIAMLLLVPLAIVMVFSFHFVMFRPGRTLVQRARRAGAHAYFGILVSIFYFWTVAFLMKVTWSQCVVEMFYFLVFLFIVLTPHFQATSQAVRKARERPACKGSVSRRSSSVSVRGKRQHSSSRSPSVACMPSKGRSRSAASRKSHCSCQSQHA